MSNKLQNLNVKSALEVFPSLKEKVLDEVTSDIVSLLAKEAPNMVSKVGDWKMSAKGILSSKEGHKLTLPINNPAVILLRFAMQLKEVAQAGEMDVTADVPKVCTSWITQKSERLSKVDAPVS